MIDFSTSFHITIIIIIIFYLFISVLVGLEIVPNKPLRKYFYKMLVVWLECIEKHIPLRNDLDESSISISKLMISMDDTKNF